MTILRASMHSLTSWSWASADRRLGPLALDAALNRPNSGKRLVVLDNIDPDFIRDTSRRHFAEGHIVNVIAKSGVTAETMATFAIVRQWMNEQSAEAKARETICRYDRSCKGRSPRTIARQEKYPVFDIPPMSAAVSAS